MLVFNLGQPEVRLRRGDVVGLLVPRRAEAAGGDADAPARGDGVADGALELEKLAPKREEQGQWRRLQPSAQEAAQRQQCKPGVAPGQFPAGAAGAAGTVDPASAAGAAGADSVANEVLDAEAPPACIRGQQGAADDAASAGAPLHAPILAGELEPEETHTEELPPEADAMALRSVGGRRHPKADPHLPGHLLAFEVLLVVSIVMGFGLGGPKAQLRGTECVMLGERVGRDGRRAADNHVEAAGRMKPVEDVSQLWGLLGLASRVGDPCPAEYVLPLKGLTRWLEAGALNGSWPLQQVAGACKYGRGGSPWPILSPELCARLQVARRGIRKEENQPLHVFEASKGR